MVTHGAIDGYSRLVVFLRCSNNNSATTVYNLFLSAIREYELPSRVRTDYGRENYRVAVHMLIHRGVRRNSMITGSSIRNQRIERFWRDMHRCVTVVYYRLFYYLEHHGYLDPDNPVHRHALQYVYLPKINQSLDVFVAGWNHHRIRTQHNLTPYQLFVQGTLQRGFQNLDTLQQVDSLYGVDEIDDAQDSGDEYTVYIPPNSFQLTEDALTQLQATVNPLSESHNFGIELYIQILQFLHTFMQ